jgi:hypothetical protein
MIMQLGSKMLEIQKQVDAFADAHQRLNRDVTGMITSTRGLISATDAYQVANKLSMAGIRASATQLEGLAKKAAEYAQATGQDIPAALEQMTSAVIAGSERGLRQFGVELDGSKDKLKNATSALDQFSAQTAGVVVKADDFTDALGALGNNAGDAAMRILEISRISEAYATLLMPLNDALSDFNGLLENSADKAGTLARTLQGTLYTALASITSIFGDNKVSRTFDEAAGHIAMEEARIQNASRERNNLLREQKDREAAAKAAARRGGGGGGGRKKESDGEVWSVEDVEAARQNEINDIVGARNQDAISREIANKVDVDMIRAAEELRLEPQQKFQEAVKERVESLKELQRAYEMFKQVELDPEVQKALQEYEAGALDRALGSKLQQLEDAANTREINEQVEQDPQVRAAMLAEERAATVAHYEEMTDMAGQFGKAWSKSLGDVSAGAMAAAGAQNLLRGAVTLVANAAINGGKLTVRAVTDMVKGVCMAIGIEATIKTVMELAEGIRAAASSYGLDPAAAGHFAAAAQYGVTAALAFGVAGGASAIGNAAGGGGKGGPSAPTGTQTGQGQYGSPGYASVGGQQQQSVVVILEGDAGGVFRVVEDENRKRSYSGQSSFRGA